MIVLRTASLSLVACATTQAFSIQHVHLVRPTTLQLVRASSTPATARFMTPPEEGSSNEKTFVSSVFKKELAFDEKSGRFFETGFGEGDCVPDEEFCLTDKETGSLIRLTQQEKERMFLDSLQVSDSSCFDFRMHTKKACFTQ
jgi:hypothetical protein